MTNSFDNVSTSLKEIRDRLMKNLTRHEREILKERFKDINICVACGAEESETRKCQCENDE